MRLLYTVNVFGFSAFNVNLPSNSGCITSVTCTRFSGLQRDDACCRIHHPASFRLTDDFVFARMRFEQDLEILALSKEVGGIHQEIHHREPGRYPCCTVFVGEDYIEGGIRLLRCPQPTGQNGDHGFLQ